MGTNILLVALGGAVGSVGRYLTVEALRRWSPDAAFPAGTFAVNTIGCFVMGIAFAALADRGKDGLTLFLLTGLLGGFTTYSAFGLDTLRLVQDGERGMAFGYVAGTLALCLAAVWGGHGIGKSIWGAS